jgi:aspartate kinase
LLEMAATGCPKPAMRSVEFARRQGVALHVRSSFTWEPGTWVREEDPSMENAVVTAVTHDTGDAKVTVQGVPDRPGIAALLFRALADHDVMVDMIVQNTSAEGRTDISFTVPCEHLELARRSCRERAAELGATEVLGDDGIAKVSLIGAGMKSHPGVSAKAFEVLAAHGVNIEMISTSSIRITCVVRAERLEQAVQALHDAFELDRPVV